MRKYRGWVGFCGALWLLSSGCDQELALPAGAGANEQEEPPAMAGITGIAGAPDEGPHASETLPLPESPTYTTFGGAGGEGQGGSSGEAGHAGPSSHDAGAPGQASRGGGGAVPGDGGSMHGGAAGADGSDMSLPPRGQLLFTEYLEGTGSLKALELHSPDGSSLEGCDLHTHFNGKLEPARLALHGELPAGGFQVLCSSALASAQPERCDRSTNLTFNGDDALVLVCDGLVLDVIGQIGVDPGEAWGDGSTADHTLRRRCAVLSGRQDGSQPFDPAMEWELFGPDIFDDLGQHACD
jgi:hypothetical protein